MAASSQRLIREGVPMEEFPQTVANLTAASQNLYERIKGRNLIAYPSEPIRVAISRAVAIESNRGWRIGKTLQSHKVDVVVALAQAALAAVRASGNYYDTSYHCCQDDVDDMVDGATQWRQGRLRPLFGPDALGAVRLGSGGYRAPRFEELWALQAEMRKGQLQ
jgi:hypothetical protein